MVAPVFAVRSRYGSREPVKLARTSAFADIGSVAPQRPWDGLLARTVHGERMSFTVVELAPGSVVPEHRHPHEQVGLLLGGSLTFVVSEESRELGPGGTWRIPGDVPHSVTTGPDGAVVVEVFSPVREDWHGFEYEEARPGRWP
jgi:quercetin dioxygenase-like cupin family protein